MVDLRKNLDVAPADCVCVGDFVPEKTVGGVVSLPLKGGTTMKATVVKCVV